ncbi:MAG: sulfotransferase [Verrucomicrobia bacterium]|nr:sulfotransferase [Verrucomicrobiota bacterium]
MRFRSTILLSFRARQLARTLAGDRGESPIISYFICTNPRSGSYLLCDGLASTSLAGRPREWFSPHGEKIRRVRWGLDKSTYATYLDQVRVRSTTRNGISGIKLHLYQFVELAKKLAEVEGFEGLTTVEIMTKAFPNLKYLWLTRRDKARQAISYLLAKKTGEWWIIDRGKLGKAEDTIDEFNFAPQEVARLEKTLTQNDVTWRSYFESNNISPLIVYYEDLAADYSGTVVRVLKWLGVPNADAVAVRPSRLKQQATTRNEDWLKRYLTYKAQQGSTSG